MIAVIAITGFFGMLFTTAVIECIEVIGAGIAMGLEVLAPAITNFVAPAFLVGL